QRHDDGVDLLVVEQRFGIDGAAIMLAGESFRPRLVGIRNRAQRAERLQCTDVVRPPIPTSQNCDTRLHTIFAKLALPTHIGAGASTQPVMASLDMRKI